MLSPPMKYNFQIYWVSYDARHGDNWLVRGNFVEFLSSHNPPCQFII